MTTEKSSTILFWIKNARAVSLPQSLLPAFTAIALAMSVSSFSLLLSVLAVLGVAIGHLGLNLFDDYFDFRVKRTDYRNNMAHEGMRARIGKCTYITSGKATMAHLLVACVAFSAVALLLGSVILYHRGIAIVYLMIATAVLGLSYSAAPLRLGYHGLGELVIGIIFGPLVMIGCFYSACGTITASAIYISIPIGLLVTNCIYVHSILDYHPDKKIGKRTLAVLLDNNRYMLIAQFIILFAPYLVITLAIALGFLPFVYLLVYLTLPIAIQLFVLMQNHVQGREEEINIKLWMGPMSGFEKYKEMGIEWFMLRWLLARNLLSLFAFIVILLGFASKFNIIQY